MDNTEYTDIKLKVDDERALYTPLSPEAEFGRSVRLYIKSKLEGMDYKNDIRLTVISRSPIDEKKFLTASLFIILSLALVKHVSVLSYTIIPVLGSVALGKAGSET